MDGAARKWFTEIRTREPRGPSSKWPAAGEKGGPGVSPGSVNLYISASPHPDLSIPSFFTLVASPAISLREGHR